MPYEPPFTITHRLIDLVGLISERIGTWQAGSMPLSPQLRRENRIRTIQASLAIENNTLSVDQVTAVLDGKAVRGLPREILEVKNAFAAYSLLNTFSVSSPADFLRAHAALMEGLVPEAGEYRRSGVGVYQGQQLVHMAPPAGRVPALVQDLMHWTKATTLHPLLVSAAVHYEIEFIHPFSDGNGRMGRLWQTVQLSAWKSQFGFLPVESIIKQRQAKYYAALAASDQAANVAPFAEFSLQALLDSLEAELATDQVADQVTDQVKRLLSVLKSGDQLSVLEIMQRLAIKHRPTFMATYLRPALAASLIWMTHPNSPRSPSQRYFVKP